MVSKTRRLISDEIERLLAFGYTYTELAADMDVHAASVVRWHKMLVRPQRAVTLLRQLQRLPDDQSEPR